MKTNAFDKEKYQHFRKKSGVYALVSKNKVVYVGSSKDIYTRILEHIIEGKKKFDNVVARTNRFYGNDDGFNDLLTRVVEIGVICKLRPPLNIIMFDNFKYWLYSLPIERINNLPHNEIDIIMQQVENTTNLILGDSK